MPPLGTAWAAARKFRIFGGFLRFLTRYRKGPDNGPRAALRRYCHGCGRNLCSGPVTTASGPNAAIAGRLPVAGDVGQLATVAGLVSLGNEARATARQD